MLKIKKVISVILITSILFSCLVGLSASAEETTIEHVSLVKEHFGWIQSNSVNVSEDEVYSGLYPTNAIGTCAFVTMSLLLSFYDAYWNDDFVASDYETIGEINISTGAIGDDFHIERENAAWVDYVTENGIDEESNEAKAAYTQFALNNSSDYLQPYLISLENQEGCGFFSGFNDYSMIGFQMVDFLEYYLYEVCDFTSEQVTVEKMSATLPNNRGNMFNKAKELINSGVPVMYCALEEELAISGHVLLGYDLTSNGNDIILSNCWNRSATTTFYQTDYKYVSSIIWLEINEDTLPHACSTSYTDDGVGYCTCQIYREHPAHTHVTSSGAPVCSAAPLNTNCYCGLAVNNTHSFSWTYTDLTHQYSCACGESMNYGTHTKRYTASNNLTHTESCDCGYSEVSEHDLNFCINYSASLHSGRCSCGYDGYESHTLVVISPTLLGCTECSYTRNRLGGGNENVHLGVEEDEDSE